MSDYDIRPGGSLKLKGGITEGGVVKKKKRKKRKSKVKSELSSKEQDLSGVEDLISVSTDKEKSASNSGRNSPALSASSSLTRKTDAEKRFEEVQKLRLAHRVAKLANKTHKDRVNEFNAQLESLSEHHDIPKVGPG